MMGGVSLLATSHQSADMAKPRWWTAGDLDGFLGLGLDNLIQILLIVALCRGVLGYPDRMKALASSI